MIRRIRRGAGHVPVPRGPGLGVEIDWDWVSRNRTAVVEYKA